METVWAFHHKVYVMETSRCPEVSFISEAEFSQIILLKFISLWLFVNSVSFKILSASIIIVETQL